MIVNKCSENLLKKSKKLYENYRDNCTVVQRMLEKYKKIYPNISDYSIMHFIDIAEFCDLIMDRQKLEDLNEDECYCLLMAARIYRSSIMRLVIRGTAKFVMVSAISQAYRDV